MNSDLPVEFPCEVMIEMTYEAARLELGDDYNEQDEDSLQGVIGESRDTIEIESLNEIPKGYEVVAWERIEPNNELK